MMRKEGTLTYNAASGRMCIVHPRYMEDLHCGDYFEVFVPEKGDWVGTSIEMSWSGKE